MKKTFVSYRGEEFEARECPKCGDKIFTEDLVMKAIDKLEAKNLKSEYLKNPIKVGHSWGITFPKDIVKSFSLGNKNKELKIHPNLEKGKIEILV